MQDFSKYNEGNFAFEVKNAIKSIFVDNKQIEGKPSEILPKELLIYLGLNGAVWPQITKNSDFETALLVGLELGFYLLIDFTEYQPCYVKVIKTDKEEDELSIYIGAVYKRLESLTANLFHHIDTAECAEYIDGKRIINEAMSNVPETKQRLKILKASMRMFGRPRIFVYRENFRDKDAILKKMATFETRVMKSDLILLDKIIISSFIEAKVK